METKIFKVVSQSNPTYISSQKQEGGQLAKSVIRLKELGGGKFGNEFVCSMFGNIALAKFYENDVVAATLRFQVHEANGNCYQDVTATDIVKISKQ